MIIFILDMNEVDINKQAEDLVRKIKFSINGVDRKLPSPNTDTNSLKIVKDAIRLLQVSKTNDNLESVIKEYCKQSKNYDIFIEFIKSLKDENGSLNKLLEYLEEEKKNQDSISQDPDSTVTRPDSKDISSSSEWASI